MLSGAKERSLLVAVKRGKQHVIRTVQVCFQQRRHKVYFRSLDQALTRVRIHTTPDPLLSRSCKKKKNNNKQTHQSTKTTQTGGKQHTQTHTHTHTTEARYRE